jgi:hypothetical protein
MSFDEEEVDPELTSYLKEPIEKRKRTFKEAFEEEVVENEEEENESEIPCTKETKEAVYRLWAQKFDEEGAKLLPVVQKLESMSEAQAKAYLACLKAVHSRSLHKTITDRILQAGSHLLCHPNDIVTPLAMQQDEYLMNGMSLIMNDILGALGKAGFLLAVVLYAGSSRLLHQEFKKITTKTNTPTETLPANGVLESSNGKNNAND